MRLSAAKIGQLATRAMQLELWATPKPGLVDRQNSGAHQDMDYQTFEASIDALAPYLEHFARIGEMRAGEDAASLFALLRQQGILAEKAMFEATRGVNTHKGMIFSLGLLCGAAGRLGALGQYPLTPDGVCAYAAEMTAGLCARELATLQQKAALSHGERTYLEFGAKGVRGEAESGYASVLRHAYPLLSDGLQQQIGINGLMVQVLIQLMAEVEDTNVLVRHGPEVARRVQEQAQAILAGSGALSASGQEAIRQLDQDFIARRISPGGCADLLAATLFIWMVCHPGQAFLLF